MKRTHKKSKITFLYNDFMNIHYQPESKAYKAINGYILQVEELDGVYVVEYLQPEDAEEYQHSAIMNSHAEGEIK